MEWKRTYKITLVIGCIAMFLLLTGCLYPAEQKATHASTGEAIASVQYAVNAYQGQNQRLPIKNSDMDTPIYQKYVIDFLELQHSGHLGRIPDAAFEMGGRYFFVLVNVEEQPEVKLMDVILAQQIGDVQRKVNQFVTRGQAIPTGEEILPGWYALDKDVFSEEDIQVKSPYSGQFLNVIVHETGTVAIDYSMDLMQLVQSEEPPPEQDVRELLVESSDFVPVSSYPYFWQEEGFVLDSPK